MASSHEPSEREWLEGLYRDAQDDALQAECDELQGRIELALKALAPARGTVWADTIAAILSGEQPTNTEPAA